MLKNEQVFIKKLEEMGIKKPDLNLAEDRKKDDQRE